MLLGYNTSGLADHDLAGAIRLVAALGYRAIAITLDYHRLNPYDAACPRQLEATRRLLAESGLTVVVETGARYLLDQRRKHQPTLVSPHQAERQRRIDFLRRSIDIAQALDARCLSFWSGTAVDAAAQDTLQQRLVDSLGPVIGHAGERGVTLAFEPEPGHFIDTLDSYAQLLRTLPEEQAGCLQLTIDIGHLHCQQEGAIAELLDRWHGRLVNVHIEDMRRGVHEHLMFGEGDIDIAAVVAALHEIEYRGPVTVELPRHSHQGPAVAERAHDYLRQLFQQHRVQEA